jgi:hypothetical protein
MDEAQLEKLRPDRPYRASIVYSRSNQHNRWYRGLVSIVAEGLGLHPDTLHAELKFKAGLIEHIIMGAAGPMPVLYSTKFSEMDEARFTEFVNLAVEIIFRDYLEGVRRGDVFKRVEELVGLRR